MQSIMQYIYDHPETVAIIWPVLTGLLSFAFGALSRRYPIVTAILRASGLDLPALGRALRKRMEPPPAPPAGVTSAAPPAGVTSADATPITTTRESDR